MSELEPKRCLQDEIKLRVSPHRVKIFLQDDIQLVCLKYLRETDKLIIFYLSLENVVDLDEASEVVFILGLIVHLDYRREKRILNFYLKHRVLRNYVLDVYFQF
jgi:hypothetical protein